VQVETITTRTALLIHQTAARVPRLNLRRSPTHNRHLEALLAIRRELKLIAQETVMPVLPYRRPPKEEKEAASSVCFQAAGRHKIANAWMCHAGDVPDIFLFSLNSS
jgi:hypothetical protein